MSEAIGAYRQITVTDEFKEAERLYEKARHDEAQALFNERRKAKKEKAIEVARILLSMGLQTEQIIIATGLTREEVESLIILT